MKRIYKYHLTHATEQTVDIPEGAKVLSIQWQAGTGLVFWALVNPENTRVKKKFFCYCTGDEIHFVDDVYIHFLETVQVGEMVYHFYEFLQ